MKITQTFTNGSICTFFVPDKTSARRTSAHIGSAPCAYQHEMSLPGILG